MSEGKQRIVLAGLDRRVLVERVNPALCRTGRFDVIATATSPDELRQATAGDYIHLVVVEANIVPHLDEAISLLGELTQKVRLVVVVPARWEKHRDKFSTLPDGTLLLTAPVNWHTAADSILDHLELEENEEQSHKATPAVQAQPVSERRPTDTETSKDPLPPVQKIKLQGASPMVRIGFYGTRGGVGTSSAALAAARILAGENHRVALFDATKRGDLHVMAEIQPVEQPVRHGAITFFLAGPTEKAVCDFDAIVVDGGRTRGAFNAEWCAISKPLSEEKIAQLVDVKPPESEKESKEDRDRKQAKKPKAKTPGFSLRNLISVEVTE
ncbi:MAG: hypothetical protein GY832_36465 [Chloroflexi bacterium]|nr:hypothetical protein [Chloroflexota bacterium]